MPTEELRKLDRIDYRVTKWMYTYGKPMLRISLAIVFIWFGALKVVFESPAQDMVAATVYWLDPEWFIPVLGIWEVLIGIFMLFKKTIRLALILLIFQIPGTFFPLIVLPEVCFENFPFVLTTEGQYIIKNLVVISAAIVAGGSIREREFVERDLKSADTE
ncbi:DoxX family membrane protein [Salegentibacter sp. HM20]